MVVSSPAKPPLSSRDRKLLRLSLVLLLLTGVVFATVWYLTRRPGPRAPFLIIPTISNDEREAQIAKAKRMRALWKRWAIEHKELLTNLKHAGSSDFAAYESLDKALPTFPTNDTAGFDIKSLVDGPYPSTKFTWAGGLHLPLPTPRNAKEADYYKRFIPYTIDQQHQQFDKQHDLLLSESVNVGTVRITLWASGRITERTEGTQMVPGKPMLTGITTHKEIVPPYDFVR